MDCGVDEPVLLEFDHVGAKRAAIAALVSRGINLVTLALEIEQCEVVCANCHRRRTARRAGWSRGGPESGAPGSRGRSPARARNVAYAYRVLRERGCADCGERDLCVLDFDHVGVKTQTVMRLAWQEVGLHRIQAEIERCEVRCANCHRRRTATRAGYYRAAAA